MFDLVFAKHKKDPETQELLANAKQVLEINPFELHKDTGDVDEQYADRGYSVTFKGFEFRIPDRGAASIQFRAAEGEKPYRELRTYTSFSTIGAAVLWPKRDGIAATAWIYANPAYSLTEIGQTQCLDFISDGYLYSVYIAVPLMFVNTKYCLYRSTRLTT